MDFSCIYDSLSNVYTCTIPYIEQIYYNGEKSYLLHTMTSGEAMISLIVFFILLFQIFVFLFDFFFPKIVEIKKWKK